MSAGVKAPNEKALPSFFAQLSIAATSSCSDTPDGSGQGFNTFSLKLLMSRGCTPSTPRTSCCTNQAIIRYSGLPQTGAKREHPTRSRPRTRDGGARPEVRSQADDCRRVEPGVLGVGGRTPANRSVDDGLLPGRHAPGV